MQGWLALSRNQALSDRWEYSNLRLVPKTNPLCDACNKIRVEAEPGLVATSSYGQFRSPPPPPVWHRVFGGRRRNVGSGPNFAETVSRWSVVHFLLAHLFSSDRFDPYDCVTRRAGSTATGVGTTTRSFAGRARKNRSGCGRKIRFISNPKQPVRLIHGRTGWGRFCRSE